MPRIELEPKDDKQPIVIYYLSLEEYRCQGLGDVDLDKMRRVTVEINAQVAVEIWPGGIV